MKNKTKYDSDSDYVPGKSDKDSDDSNNSSHETSTDSSEDEQQDDQENPDKNDKDSDDADEDDDDDDEDYDDEAELTQQLVFIIGPTSKQNAANKRPSLRVKTGRVAKKTKYVNPKLDNYSRDNYEYYRKLPTEHKDNIDKLEGEIHNELQANGSGGTIPRRFTLLANSDIDKKTKCLLLKKLDVLDHMTRSDNEYFKLNQWMDGALRIPFGKYKEAVPRKDSLDKTLIKDILQTTKTNLDTKVYGHHEVKDHIVRILAQWMSNPNGKGIVIGIQGAAGCGKTTLVKDGICNSLALPFIFLPLGGMADRAEFVGHSYTYEGARWGRIVDSLIKSKYMNPVFFFDELDKVSDTKHGEEIINILMQITDASQNDKFHDSYFSDFEFDLSRCIVIFSYNDESNISPILRDRMIKIEAKGYKTADKVTIAQKHLIPTLHKEFNINDGEIRFTDDILRFMIEYIESEQGVRNIKRALHDVVSNLHLNILIGELQVDGLYTVTKDDVFKFVYKNKVDNNLSHSMMYL